MSENFQGKFNSGEITGNERPISAVDEKLIEDITRRVISALAADGRMQIGNSSGSYVASSSSYAVSRSSLLVKEVGEAQTGRYPDEVVVGLAPAFGTSQQETITGIPHSRVLKEIAAGVEEEGMRVRYVKIYDTSDVGFIALQAAKLSGSGIGVGIQSKGTCVIHQRDLYPLTNLELFPQAPMITEEIFRKIGKNAARYAKGQSPVPIHVENDCMTRPKFQARAAILHIKETELVDGGKPVELEVTF